ncbi:protein SRC2 homolog [Cornus florida]|uniref:protein SRC2 homolog n=1 Tax=Cornus florida TaxID=4283 RepID=UPI002896FC82|nr:protein SRC2 homolog [Cornus florida]
MACCSKPQADMDCTEFKINLISARNLKPGKFFSMQVYATVSISDDPSSKKQTPVDDQNGINPAWNFTTVYAIDETAVRHDCTALIIKLYCQRWIGDRYIGEVHVSLKELYKRARKGCSFSNTVEYSVRKGSVFSMGKVRFSYGFRGTLVNVDGEKPSSCNGGFRDVAIVVLKVSLKFIFGIDITI